MNETQARPDPDELLARINHENSIPKNPTLKIFLGMAAGVGKTYAMLQEARTARAQGTDIVLGIIETHARPDTAELLGGLEILPRRSVNYKGIILEELDIDAVIARHPE
ncbi:MAG: sensor histidine kinase KdpD, partial [Spirochaetaceae bacterium]|nr:sensor histidine kinase KdpD [Spirochaetaceae bacterium]